MALPFIQYMRSSLCLQDGLHLSLSAFQIINGNKQKIFITVNRHLYRITLFITKE